MGIKKAIVQRHPFLESKGYTGILKRRKAKKTQQPSMKCHELRKLNLTRI